MINKLNISRWIVSITAVTIILITGSYLFFDFLSGHIHDERAGAQFSKTASKIWETLIELEVSKANNAINFLHENSISLENGFSKIVDKIHILNVSSVVLISENNKILNSFPDKSLVGTKYFSSTYMYAMKHNVDAHGVEYNQANNEIYLEVVHIDKSRNISISFTIKFITILDKFNRMIDTPLVAYSALGSQHNVFYNPHNFSIPDSIINNSMQEGSKLKIKNQIFKIYKKTLSNNLNSNVGQILIFYNNTSHLFDRKIDRVHKIITIAIISIFFFLLMSILTKRFEIKLNKVFKRLVDQEQKLKATLDGAEIATWEYFPNEDKLVWDQRMLELFGTSSNKITGTISDWSSRVLPQALNKANHDFNQLLNNNQKFYIEFPIQTDNGDIKYLAGAATVKRDLTGLPIKVLGINFDITKRVNEAKEKELLLGRISEYKLLASIGSLTSGIAHEINNPLMIIKGIFTKHIGNNCIEDIPKILNSIDRIITITETLKRVDITQNKKTFNKIELNQTIKSSLLLLTKYDQEIDCDLTCSYSNENIFISADHDYIRQILDQLVYNSKDAIYEKKNLGIIKIIISQTKDDAILTFIDNGEGMSDLTHIFEPFYTTKRDLKRVGLGLSIVNVYIQILNGQIKIQSDKNIGTTVQIKIPKFE